MAVKGSCFLVGTSGWFYDHWKGVFYPDNIPKKEWFEYYCKYFQTVEINATFYRRFKDQTYYNWAEKVHDDFTYVLKMPRLITHRKFLKDCSEEIREFSRSASLLGNKLGLLLLQLAPQTPYDPELLESVVRSFNNSRIVAIEFRDKKWLTGEIKKILIDAGAVFCNVDSPKLKCLDWITGEIAYIRLHGRTQWYRYNYSDKELKEIANIARGFVGEGAKKVYIFFNNDFNGYAPKNAKRLMELLVHKDSIYNNF
jgi:uncharacterized protein YecE (DUF72 family)